MTYGKEQAKILGQQVKVTVLSDLNAASCRQAPAQTAAKKKLGFEPADPSLPLAERIAENLRRCREALHWPQYVASQKAGLSNSVWQKLENGTIPRIETLEKICKALGVTASDILGF